MKKLTLIILIIIYSSLLIAIGTIGIIFHTFLPQNLIFENCIATQEEKLTCGLVVVFSYFIFWLNSGNIIYENKSIIALPIESRSYKEFQSNE